MSTGIASKAMNAAGVDVEIRGRCQSACTLITGVIPKSRLCFVEGSHLVQDAGLAQGELASVFGWKMKVLRNARAGTLANYPMQAAGADMLWLVCVMAVDRNIPICVPIHDAIAVEAASTEIASVVNEMSVAWWKLRGRAGDPV